MSIKDVREYLQHLEEVNGCKILYATECGSHAYGLAGPTSDYDVRCIYAYSYERYIDLRDPPQQIHETAGDIDFVGWDVKKAIGLLEKSNPTILEWIRSPMGYQVHPLFYCVLDTLARTTYQPKALHWHYLSMARSAWVAHITAAVHLHPKKYFRVLHPLLAVRWLRDHQILPPLDFLTCLADEEDHIPDKVMRAIQTLVARKQAGVLGDQEVRQRVIDEWIVEQFQELAEMPFPQTTQAYNPDIWRAAMQYGVEIASHTSLFGPVFEEVLRQGCEWDECQLMAVRTCVICGQRICTVHSHDENIGPDYYDPRRFTCPHCWSGL